MRRRIGRGGVTFALGSVALLAACLGEWDPVSPDLPDCVFPQVDTSGWQRVEQSRQYNNFTVASVSYLVPPTFDPLDDFTWERGATRLTWQSRIDEPPVLPFPEMQYAGSCRARIGGVTVVFDYGGLSAGGPAPDATIVATWRNVQMIGANGDIVFSARMRDHSDARIIERILYSVEIQRGPGGGT
jgi:hypothetical protein